MRTAHGVVTQSQFVDVMSQLIGSASMPALRRTPDDRVVSGVRFPVRIAATGTGTAALGPPLTTQGYAPSEAQFEGEGERHDSVVTLIQKLMSDVGRLQQDLAAAQATPRPAAAVATPDLQLRSPMCVRPVCCAAAARR